MVSAIVFTFYSYLTLNLHENVDVKLNMNNYERFRIYNINALK